MSIQWEVGAPDRPLVKKKKFLDRSVGIASAIEPFDAIVDANFTAAQLAADPLKYFTSIKLACEAMVRTTALGGSSYIYVVPRGSFDSSAVAYDDSGDGRVALAGRRIFVFSPHGTPAENGVLTAGGISTAVLTQWKTDGFTSSTDTSGIVFEGISTIVTSGALLSSVGAGGCTVGLLYASCTSQVLPSDQRANVFGYQSNVGVCWDQTAGTVEGPGVINLERCAWTMTSLGASAQNVGAAIWGSKSINKMSARRCTIANSVTDLFFVMGNSLGTPPNTGVIEFDDCDWTGTMTGVAFGAYTDVRFRDNRRAINLSTSYLQFLPYVNVDEQIDWSIADNVWNGDLYVSINSTGHGPKGAPLVTGQYRTVTLVNSAANSGGIHADVTCNLNYTASLTALTVTGSRNLATVAILHPGASCVGVDVTAGVRNIVLASGTDGCATPKTGYAGYENSTNKNRLIFEDADSFTDLTYIQKSEFDNKGDLLAGTGSDTFDNFPAGADDTIPMYDSSQATGLKAVASGTGSTQAFGDAAAVGTDDLYARGGVNGHKHAMPADPVPAHEAASDPHPQYTTAAEATTIADTELATHTGDTTDAHDASAISSVPAGNLASTDVQAALNELDTEKISSIAVKDEGVAQGNATTFDFVGSGVTASVAAGTATITVSGGGGGSGDEPSVADWIRL